MRRERCPGCRHHVPVVAAPGPRGGDVYRKHPVAPGSFPCPRSGHWVDPGQAIPLVIRRRTAAELAPWIGPRRWEESDI